MTETEKNTSDLVPCEAALLNAAKLSIRDDKPIMLANHVMIRKF